MSRKEKCWDSAPIESFFSTLERVSAKSSREDPARSPAGTILPYRYLLRSQSTTFGDQLRTLCQIRTKSRTMYCLTYLTYLFSYFPYDCWSRRPRHLAMPGAVKLNAVSGTSGLSQAAPTGLWI